MNTLIIIVFVIGYLAIAFEDIIKSNKSASALITGILCWVIYTMQSGNPEMANHQLMEHLGGLAGVLFFLLGAMTIVELIDSHDGFQVITNRIKTKKLTQLAWTIGLITFFLSAALDNLTTTIVMLSLMRKISDERDIRLMFAGIIVIAANAGGAWSPLGDVTTTMLWIGGQISATNIMLSLIIPSLVCFVVPLLIISYQWKGKILKEFTPIIPETTTSVREQKLVFCLGIGALVFVPIFKMVTHLPPFMGMLFALGVLWTATEWIHRGKGSEDRDFLSVVYALRKIDTPSILFFLGILLAITALESVGVLKQAALYLNASLGNESAIAIFIGLLSALVDNVPLVAAAQGMYPLAEYPQDHYLWEFFAYTTGTGGSILIIGSAAGVAAMGIEKIGFIWYLKRISLLALVGFLAGAFVFIGLSNWLS